MLSAASRYYEEILVMVRLSGGKVRLLILKANLLQEVFLISRKVQNSPNVITRARRGRWASQSVGDDLQLWFQEHKTVDHDIFGFQFGNILNETIKDINTPWC